MAAQIRLRARLSTSGTAGEQRPLGVGVPYSDPVANALLVIPVGWIEGLHAGSADTSTYCGAMGSVAPRTRFVRVARPGPLSSTSPCDRPAMAIKGALLAPLTTTECHTLHSLFINMFASPIA